MRFAFPIALIAMQIGCSREYYFRGADRESYCAIAERNMGPWAVPDVQIEPSVNSRVHAPESPVCPPMPPDDPAAHQYMHCANGMKGYSGWEKDGVLTTNEFTDAWQLSLPRESDGSLLLTPEKAVELGQIHSTSFLFEKENLYLSALALTLNRFEFSTQWYLLNNTFYQHSGASSLPTESNTLTPTTNFGFTKAFAAGGQLLVDFANTFVFQYSGKDAFTVNSNLAATFIQPILKNGGRNIRMESLTQGERNLLYGLRDFARFRKQFCFNITMRDGGFLGLLLQQQNIRNQEENVKRLEQIYQLHNFLRQKGGSVSTVQVDQIFLSLKQGQAGLIQSKTSYENSLDSYKFLLSLPVNLPVRIDDSLLNQFQLNTPEADQLQSELNEFDLKMRQMDEPPTLEVMTNYYRQMESYLKRAESIAENVREELKKQTYALPKSGLDADQQQAKADFSNLEDRLLEMDEDLKELKQHLAEELKSLNDKERKRDWDRLQRRIHELIAIHGDLVVYQVQVRVYSVSIKPFALKEKDVIEEGLSHRFDLMNEKARVVDAWRKVSLAANALEPGLAVVAGGNLGTDPLATNPFDFSAQASSLRIGVQLESPLNRQIERNAFRASLIQYHRQRRSFQNRTDQVVQSLRRTVRQLETDRLNFEISRQSLIAAARQLEAARGRLLLGSDANPATGTLDTLSALASLLQAKNTLIANWVNYETDRMQLLLDMEALQLNERGYYDEPTFIRNTEPATNPQR